MVAIRRIERVLSLQDIKPNQRNARVHSNKQIGQIADSIKAFGFGAPILVDETFTLIAGHGRLKAAKLLGLKEIPAIELRGLSAARKRALALADNKICDNAGWDREQLAIEIPELAELLIEDGLDIGITGFSSAEFDQLQIDFEQDSSDPDDGHDPNWHMGPAVSERGSLWLLGQHRLLCGDARSEGDFDRLMDSNRAAMSFADVPYNLVVRSIGGRGRTKHPEFAMASGEMSSSKYIDFLVTVLGNCSRASRNGAIHFVCCDWRHVTDIIEAGRPIYDATLNIVVWVKSNAGQGSFYRSQHELIVVFRVGEAAHLNNIELGRHGRSRSNVWNYAGVNAFRAGRMDELRWHPTAKPVALVADAMRDCTRRGDVVLDAFSGSGTTIMAAERVGRRAYAMEIEPCYVDVAIRRWQAFTRKDAVHAETGRSFDQLTAERSNISDEPRSRRARQRNQAAPNGPPKETTDERVPLSSAREQSSRRNATKPV
jgi:DNA modification methylase